MLSLNIDFKILSLREGFGIMKNERHSFYGFQSKTLMLFSFKKLIAQKRLSSFGDYNGKVKYILCSRQ